MRPPTEEHRPRIRAAREVVGTAESGPSLPSPAPAGHGSYRGISCRHWGRRTTAEDDPKQTECPWPIGRRRAGGLYSKVIMSVRLSVVAFGFKGSFAKFALPEFKTL